MKSSSLVAPRCLRPIRGALLAATLFAVLPSHLPAQEAAKKSTCKAIYENLESNFLGLPTNYRGLKGSAAKALGQTVENDLVACRKYLSSCNESADRTAGVHFYMANNLYLLSARFRNALIQDLRKKNPKGEKFPSERLQERISSYYMTIASHAKKSFEGLPAKHELRPQALKVLGQSLAGAKDYSAAAMTYEQYRTLYPKNKEFGNVMIALARAYLNLDDFDTGLEIVRIAQATKDIYNSPSYPYLGEALWKLQEKKGNVSGMLEATRAVLAIYPMRMKEKISNYAREDYNRYIIFNGFREGYSLFALGRNEDAASCLTDYIAEMIQRDAKKREIGSQLAPFARIYMKRAEDTLFFIQNLADQPAPNDLDLQGLWVTEQRVSIRKNKDNVIAIVFRGAGDARSAPFLQGLDEFCSQEKKLSLVSVSYLKSDANVDAQLDVLRNELSEMGYASAAGFDADAQKKATFRAFKANVGSATFIVVDPNGSLVWFQQDPRAVDVNLARSILVRVRDEG